MLRRLRIRFICINMGIVLVMLTGIFALVIATTRQSLERESLALMRSALAGSGQPERRGLPGRSGGSFGTREEEPEPPEGDFGFFLPYLLLELGPEGEIRMVHGAGGVPAEDREALAALAAEALAAPEETGVLRDWELRYLRAAGPVGTRLVFTDLSTETATLRGLVRTSAAVGAAGLAVFFVISLLLARWAVRPVELAWEQQRQFVSDASHELKTPLTVIMTNAELLRESEGDAAAMARFGENILTMARQMRSLVERLLDLARVENTAAAAAAEDVDLSRLCAETVLPFEPLYFEKGLALRAEIAEDVHVTGNENHLRQVLEILLDNAQKYAAPGAAVEVRLSRSGRSCRMSVSNDGEPIAPEDLNRLFERFYRADKSRSRDGSYGLGLSIARKFVEEHHGKIRAESAGGVNSFLVTLPRRNEKNG